MEATGAAAKDSRRGSVTALLDGFDLLVLPIIVAGGHRHQHRLHAAVALAPQDPQAIVEVLELLIDSLALVGRRGEEVVQPRDGEAESREAQLVREGIPLRQGERAQRLVPRDQRFEAPQLLLIERLKS